MGDICLICGELKTDNGLIVCDSCNKQEKESESAKLERGLIYLYGKHNI